MLNLKTKAYLVLELAFQVFQSLRKYKMTKFNIEVQLL